MMAYYPEINVMIAETERERSDFSHSYSNVCRSIDGHQTSRIEKNKTHDTKRKL